MPPRRSTRSSASTAASASTSASTAPPPPVSTRTTRRSTRASTTATAIESDEDVKPDIRKPAPRASKPVSKPASKAAPKPAPKPASKAAPAPAPSSRSKAVVKPVSTRSRRVKAPTPEPESEGDEEEDDDEEDDEDDEEEEGGDDEDEEDEDEEDADDDDDESEQEAQVRKPTRGAPKKRVVESDSSDGPAPRKPVSKRSKPTPPNSRGKAGTPVSKGKTASVSVSPPVSKGKTVSATPPVSKGKVTPPVSQSKASTPRASRVSAAAPAAAQEDSESEPDDLLADLPRTPLRGAPTPKRPHPATDDEGSGPADSSPNMPSSVLPKTPGARPPMSTIATPAAAPVSNRSKPRLTIHKLVLVNFKSYAGRQEIGPFHKSFSAIVGPNGSGKSNTIDALLFVFGYRASKMRQGKLSELIHNSAGMEGLESCSVEVWFREIVDLPGVDDFLLVPNSQLIVTRTAFRNNSSKYTINDRSSSFTEVTTLLKGKGIDLDHNRFLILQGEVESIALMKAKAQNEHEDGLLEYLEDIIGTTQYKTPIEAANLEVEQLNEDRAEKMSRLRVVEREKAALEDKKREAESFLRDTNELTRKKSLLWQFHMHTLNGNIEITTKSIDKLNGTLVEEQERNAHHLAEIENLQKGYEAKLADYDEVKRLTDTLVKDAKKIEKDEVGLQEKKKHLVSKQKKLKKSISDDGHVKSGALSSVSNCAEAIETNRTKVTELESKLEAEEAELEEIRDSLKDKTDEFTTKIEAKQRELEPWTAKISDKQSAMDVAQSERDLLAQKAATAQSALEEAEAALESVRESDQSKQEEYQALKKEHAKATKHLAAAEAKLQTHETQSQALRAKMSNARHKTDEAKASLAADKSENAVLASLNKLKAQGRIKGFHGRLGDLGVIDDKYDVAVTTACGALNNLVVDTVEQGQACIEHLRKGNVGRASFMVLEKLPPRDLNAIQTPEGVPRLFDLIKPKDPRFAAAFYKGLRDTLVAEDLQQAQRIGYGKKRWRVVTLAGQLIDPSGTMSGGGARVSRGGMSSKFKADKVAPEVVARYEQECAAAEQEFTAFQTDKRGVEQLAAQLRKRIPDIEMEMEKIELDVQTCAKRITEAEKRITELRSQSKPDAADEKRIKVLDAEIAALTKDVSKLREKSSAISEDIKELQNKILEVGGVKLRAIQSKFTTTKGLLDLASDAITKAEVGQAKSARDAEKAEKSIVANTAKLDEVEAELAVVETDLQTSSTDLAAIREKVDEAQEASTDVQDALAQAKTELDEASTEVNAFRKLEMDIKQKIDDNTRVQKDSKDKFKHWAKRHDELELAYIDEEDEDDDEDAGKPDGDEAEAEAEAEADADADADAEPKDKEMAEGEAGGEDGDADADSDAASESGSPAKRKASKNDSLELPEYSPDELRDVDKDILNGEITALEEEIAKAKPNLNVLHEYRRREAEFLDRARELEAVTSQRDSAKDRYDGLRKVRLDEFMAGFNAISAKLKEMYQMITMGGNAEIELVDTMDPFSEGVVLSIMPPKKSWRPIANLSGGEKTLASLALVFALHVFKPTPLYFMDEIDAALDFKNVSIVANYIQSKTQAAQFIVISLRNDMFELAHRLVGIYKTSNCTKSVAIDNKDLRTQAVRKKAADVPPTPKTLQAAPLPGSMPPTPAPMPRASIPSTLGPVPASRVVI